MEVKDIITERFLLFVEYIKNKSGYSNKEIEAKLFMHKNEISNLNSSKQKRFVSSDTLYWAQKMFKANALYLLNLSEEMFLNNSIKSTSKPESQDHEDLLEKIRLLEKTIEDKNEIISLQKSLMNGNNKKSKEKIG